MDLVDEWIRGDLREAARQVLPPDVWGYFFGGAGREITLAESCSQWKRARFRPTVLGPHDPVSIAARWRGRELACPIVVAPVAFQGLLRPEAECGLARAAGLARVGFTASSRSTRALARVVDSYYEGKNSRGALSFLSDEGNEWRDGVAQENFADWLCFQVYMMKRLDASKDLVALAADAGFDQFAVTLDTPFLGKRYRDLDSGFSPHAHLEKVLDQGLRDGPAFGFGYLDNEIDQAEWFGGMELGEVFGERSPIGKGVLAPAACERWREVGGQDVWISNHGGRQLDRVIGTRQALSDCLDWITGHGVESIVDGGISGPEDVVVALCGGARLVAVGRQVIAAYAVGGVEGAAAYLVELVLGVRHILGLLGVSDVAGLSPEFCHVD